MGYGYGVGEGIHGGRGGIMFHHPDNMRGRPNFGKLAWEALGKLLKAFGRRVMRIWKRG